MPRFARRYPLFMTEEETGGGGGSASLPAGGGEPGLEGGGGSDPSPQPWEALPKSWTMDMETHWKAAPREVREFAHRREADVEKLHGVYRDKSGRYDRLSGVFKEYTDSNPSLDVTAVYEALAQNHIALMRAEPEQRRELFLSLAKQYGLDFAQAAAGGQPPSKGDGLTAAQKAELKELLGPVFTHVSEQQKANQTRALADASKVVDAFASDPKNKYFKEVGALAGQIIQSGQSSDLREAYELACMRTPSVRGKYLADLHAAGLAAPGGEGSPGPRNMKSSTEGAPPPTGKSTDEALNAIAKKHWPGWAPSSTSH